MPEGHVLHRAARLQSKRFADREVRLSSPQGRFAEGAAHLDGHRLERIHAHGKHLLYDFDTGESIHVHLGLFGKFRVQTHPAPDPSPNCRLLIDTDTDRLHLAGPTACEVLEPGEVERLLDRLGPDPILDPPDGVDRLAARLARRRVPIGRVLLDQSVVAGIGNVYRSEFLFLLGIHPFTPANEVTASEVEALWGLSVVELKAGERLGRIVTVDPDEVGAANRRSVPRSERLYAYKRHGKPCRRCATEIVAADIDGRNVWWCPTCQPGRA